TDRSILLSSSTAICRITCSVLFFLSLPLPPTSTLFPYTTLFRSEQPSSHAGQFVSHRDREKPPSHHEAHDTSRGQLRDNRQADRSEEHTSELQSRSDLVCRLLLEKKKKPTISTIGIPGIYHTSLL